MCVFFCYQVVDVRPKSAYDFDAASAAQAAEAEAAAFAEALGDDAVRGGGDGAARAGSGGDAVRGDRGEAADARRVDGVPQAIGHAPYGRQAVNTASSLGQVVLLHRPARAPLAVPGRYQLVVAAAADTLYTVGASVCECALCPSYTPSNLSSFCNNTISCYPKLYASMVETYNN